ncbi:MFS transporter [Calidifontibacillus erzurumensis]|uniref:MFS transporter n=1 Tax=Calidifontibacillus erzurumensis TaxID=2741433 RepID=A0A8J8GEN8_9BACI|nr:MFS transporter [Calidifontibacillus erzurumensis]NSL50870.1 MFS transporter [Calidifontibacillus erzurumensis]
MNAQLQNASVQQSPIEKSRTVYHILFIIGLVHLLNDTIQAVVPAMFPILAKSLGFNFTQLGMIAFAVNMTASLMQPVVGVFSDKHPMPKLLPIGLSFSLVGMLGLALAPSYGVILLSVMLLGIGSATFHPEASKVAHMASGNRKGFGQSVFQVGGNAGQSLAPLITALVLVPLGQKGAIWFTFVAFLAVLILIYISKWYGKQLLVEQTLKKHDSKKAVPVGKAIKIAFLLLVFLVFVRQFYHAAITNYFAFHLIDKFGLGIDEAQFYIFLFLAAGAVGTFLGGPIADKIGMKNVLFYSMALAAPLCIMLPYAGKVFSMVLLTAIGFILLCSFSVSVVYAHQLLPGKVGMVSGMIIGLSFGLGAIGSIALGWLGDQIGISTTLLYASFLPLIGVLTAWLPNEKKIKELHQENK